VRDPGVAGEHGGAGIQHMQRGWGVHMEGPLFRVGNRLMSRARLSEVARRERSLLGGT